MARSIMPEICKDIVFEGTRAVVCTVDLSSHDLRLVYRDRKDQVYGSVTRAVAGLAAIAQTPVLAMNAGMYHADMLPVGLYVENSVEIAPLNTGEAFGNFFLKPNGVFFVGEDGQAAVQETLAYQVSGVTPAFATQSGPMLVIDGNIHPRFLPDGTSKHTRNGIGVREDGTVVLAITRDPINLWGFANLFRDFSGCPNALFFDGAVSSLALGTRMEISSGEPAGPVIAVFEKSGGGLPN